MKRLRQQTRSSGVEPDLAGWLAKTLVRQARLRERLAKQRFVSSEFRFSLCDHDGRTASEPRSRGSSLPSSGSAGSGQ